MGLHSWQRDMASIVIALIALTISLGLVFVVLNKRNIIFPSNNATNSSFAIERLLINQIESLENKNRNLAQRVAFLENKNLKHLIEHINLDSEINKYSKCVLEPTKPGPFQTIYTSCGIFFVSLQNVETYLNGVKIHLRIGNPMTSSYNGATLKITYGNALGDTNDPNCYVNWLKSLKNMEVSITDQLNSGRWNETTAILANIKPEDFGYLELAMETNNLSLMVPYPKQY